MRHLPSPRVLARFREGHAHVLRQSTGNILILHKTLAPNHDELIGRTDTANSDGRGGVRVRECERVCACMYACAMCLQYTIIIFYPG